MSPEQLLKNQFPELASTTPLPPNYKELELNYHAAQLEHFGKQIEKEADRYNQNKLRLDLLPIIPLEKIAQVLTKSLNKYVPRNWERGMPWSYCYASTLRHLFAWWRREETDPETGISHLAHAACNILFLLEYEELKKGTDDRPNN